MNLSKLAFSLLLILLAPVTSISQTIDNVDLGGVKKFVYPFDQEVEISFYFWNATAKSKSKSEKYSYDQYLLALESDIMVADSMIISEEEFKILQKIVKTNSYKKLVRLYIPKFGVLPTKEEFNMYRSYSKKNKYNSSNKREDSFLKSRKLIRAIRANPYPLLLQKYHENVDIVPVLNPIPDGDYIQYYNNYCKIDKKGNCEWISDQIAGYFSIKNNALHGEATWIGLQGDTLKHGIFEEGLKQGIWKINTYEIDYLDEYSAELYIENGTPEIDTLIQFIEFKNGSMNGSYKTAYANGSPITEGHYSDNEMSGE